MNILVVTEHFWPEMGGAEVMLRRLTQQWSENNSGHHVCVWTRQWSSELPSFEQIGRVSVLRHPVSNLRFLGTAKYILGLRSALRNFASQRNDQKEFPDVIYVSMLKFAAYGILPMAHKLKIPVVLRAEGAGETGDIAWQKTHFAGQRIMNWCQRAAAVVAPGIVVEKEMLEAGYSRPKVHRIENGAPIPEQPWVQADCSKHRREQMRRDLPTIIYTGRLHSEKGLSDLIQAASLLIKNHQLVNVLLVGDGPERNHLEALARQLGIVEHVHFAGVVVDVESLLRSADVYVLPSYQEGLSVSLLEALGLGMPVIASDIPPNRGIVDTELLTMAPVRNPAELARLIAEELANPDGGIERRTQARSKVARDFSIARTAERHLSLFESLLVGELPRKNAL